MISKKNMVITAYEKTYRWAQWFCPVLLVARAWDEKSAFVSSRKA
jgi:hypothetical protein